MFLVGFYMAEHDIYDYLYMLERYLAIDFISTSSFESVCELHKKMKQDLSADDKRKVLNFFVKNAQNKHMNHSDLLPMLAAIFACAIADNDETEILSKQERCAYLKAMFYKNNKFTMRAATEILREAPSLAETFYENMGEFPKDNPNEGKPYCKIIENIFYAAQPEFAFRILKDIYENPLNKDLQAEFYKNLGNIYADKSKDALKPYIFALIKRENGTDSSYYSNLKIALDKGTNPREILTAVNDCIDSASNAAALLIAYGILGKDIPEKAPELKKKAQDIIRRAVKNNPNNSRTTKKRADIYLENWQNLRGGAIIGQRVAKCEAYPNAWKTDFTINQERPSKT